MVVRSIIGSISIKLTIIKVQTFPNSKGSNKKKKKATQAANIKAYLCAYIYKT